MNKEIAFPTATAMLKLLRPAEPAGKDAIMWYERAVRFVEVIWPVMNVQAKEIGLPVSEDIWNAINTLDLAEAFINSHPFAREAVELRAYLEAQPGYGYTNPSARADARLHYGVIPMMIDRALKQLKKETA
jgi:hypothetical protein